MKNLVTNWKTTVAGLIPLIAYALSYAGAWPASIPLPPIEQSWTFVLALFGVGAVAKDSNVTGGTTQQ